MPANHPTRSQADLAGLLEEVRACRICAASLPHDPRPVVQVGQGARVLVIGQAPGSKVHASGRAWDDDSGDRLRAWTGLEPDAFYDPDRVAHMPSGLCYPGKGSGGDLPPRPECAPHWHAALRAHLPEVRLTLLVGRYAQMLYLPRGFARNMTQAVAQWRAAPAGLVPLPHPSWRSRLWMGRNPWYETEFLPDLRARVRAALEPARDADGARDQNV